VVSRRGFGSKSDPVIVSSVAFPICKPRKSTPLMTGGAAEREADRIETNNATRKSDWRF